MNRVVRVEIHSQDVDHSWWVPELGGKFDAIPGRTTHTWFQARKMGTYRGQCGEFCGVFHAEMAARVLVETDSAYRSFLSSASDPMVLGGQEWSGVCAKCHGISGKGGYGPAIQNNSVLVQHEGLLRLLNEGQNVLKPLASYMPPVGRGWSDAQVKALETYLKAHIYKGTTGGG